MHWKKLRVQIVSNTDFKKVTRVWSTFAPRDDKTKRTIWGSDELQEEGPIRERLDDPAHRTHYSGGKCILNTQGSVKLVLRAVRTVEAEIHHLSLL